MLISGSIKDSSGRATRWGYSMPRAGDRDRPVPVPVHDHRDMFYIVYDSKTKDSANQVQKKHPQDTDVS